jgi:hypothetical protein
MAFPHDAVNNLRMLFRVFTKHEKRSARFVLA